MANRDPQRASRVAGGCGYIAVGVEPGACHGVTPVDPATLEDQIKKFLGEDGPIWQPVWLSHDEKKHVLVIIVDPPCQGDPIHTLRRAFAKYDDGDVFVRRNGGTHKASSKEISDLSARLQDPAGSERLAVELIVGVPLQPVPLDISDENIEDWLDEKRACLLQPLDEQSVEEDETGKGTDTGGRYLDRTMPNGISSAIEQFQAASHFFSNMRKPEDRSPEEFRERVEDYIEDLRATAKDVAIDRHIEQDACRISLTLCNPTDYPFRQVEVEVYIPGEAVEARKRLSGSSLPRPPRPWGERWINPMESVLDRSYEPLVQSPLLGGRFIPDVGPSLDIDNHGSVTLSFPATDLAPRAAVALEDFYLIVPATFSGDELVAQWTARSISVPGVVEGTLTLSVFRQAANGVDLLEIEQDPEKD